MLWLATQTTNAYTWLRTVRKAFVINTNHFLHSDVVLRLQIRGFVHVRVTRGMHRVVRRISTVRSAQTKLLVGKRSQQHIQL